MTSEEQRSSGSRAAEPRDSGEQREADVLVVGSGIAGCAAALGAAREGADVLVATKASRPEDAATDWAQGGVAVTRSDPEQFAADIRTASAGAAEADAVEVLVSEAGDAVRDVLVETLGVPFDTDGEDFDFAREAAHSTARVLHVNAATGRHVLRPFLAYLDAHGSVTVAEDTAALDLITHEGRIHGALLESGRDVTPAFAGATGGIGACFESSTNPEGATGDGVAMAALAGAEMDDMEYVQFHPTVYAGDDPFLVSEAVRGEGATLRNADGERFMPDYHPDAELAPRDAVARAVADERAETGDVVLDVSDVDFRESFPGLADACEERGVSLPDIPVEPAEHFLCGGVAVDEWGRTSLDRLYAAGECARTGVHGANRLASTSLLEGLVWGLRAGGDAAGQGVERVEAPDLLDRDPALPDGFAADKFHRLRRVMDEEVGLRRTPEGLRRAEAAVTRLKGEVDAYIRTRVARDLYELRNAAVSSLLVTRAARENEAFRGCHYVETGASAPN